MVSCVNDVTLQSKNNNNLVMGRTPPISKVNGTGIRQHLVVDGEIYRCVKSF